MSAPVSTPQELAQFVAFTEPGTQVIGTGPTGQPIEYPVDTIVAFASAGGEGSRHAGRADVERADRRELSLPEHIGGAVMDVLEENGYLNCHGFANRVVEGMSGENVSYDVTVPGYETATLAAGEKGLIGSPSTGMVNKSGLMMLNPGEPHHTVVGLGLGSPDVIDVATLGAQPTITPLEPLVAAYREHIGTSDAGMYRTAPPQPITPPKDPYNPFS
jgi:hypothetical protein